MTNIYSEEGTLMASQENPMIETETTALVAYFRNGGECAEMGGGCNVMDAASGCTCARAADTITRLAAEVERLKTGFQGACYACEPVGELNLRLNARVADLEGILNDAPKAIRIAAESSPYAANRVPAFVRGLLDGYEAAAQVVEHLARAALSAQPEQPAPSAATGTITTGQSSTSNVVRTTPKEIEEKRKAGLISYTAQPEKEKQP